MDFFKRIKSPVVITSVLAQIVLIIGLFYPDLSDTVKIIGTAVIEIFTLVGVLNNPSDPENW